MATRPLSPDRRLASTDLECLKVKIPSTIDNRCHFIFISLYLPHAMSSCFFTMRFVTKSYISNCHLKVYEMKLLI